MHITSFGVPFNSVKYIHVVIQLVSVKQLSISPSLQPLASTCYFLFLWIWPSKRASESILENGAANLQTKILTLIHPMTGASFKISILENHVLIFMVLPLFNIFWNCYQCLWHVHFSKMENLYPLRADKSFGNIKRLFDIQVSG